MEPVFCVGDSLDELKKIEDGTVHLVVTSPPYDVGKSYENTRNNRTSLEYYREFSRKILKEIYRVTTKNASICWQVGNRVSDVNKGCIDPLSSVLYETFKELGYYLLNQVTWRQPSGLHHKHRLSARNEYLLWYVKDPTNYVFNLDEVRIPSQEPCKKGYKGPRKGELTGNPSGKNPSDFWELMQKEFLIEGVMEFSNVKAKHGEKTIHPCQFPIEFVERCVLCFSREGDVVLDPFCGVGTTAIAANFHGRRSIGIDRSEEYIDLARERFEKNRFESRSRIKTNAEEKKNRYKNQKYPNEWVKQTLLRILSKPRIIPYKPSEYGIREEQIYEALGLSYANHPSPEEMDSIRNTQKKNKKAPVQTKRTKQVTKTTNNVAKKRGRKRKVDAQSKKNSDKLVRSNAKKYVSEKNNEGDNDDDDDDDESIHIDLDYDYSLSDSVVVESENPKNNDAIFIELDLDYFDLEDDCIELELDDLELYFESDLDEKEEKRTRRKTTSITTSDKKKDLFTKKSRF